MISYELLCSAQQGSTSIYMYARTHNKLNIFLAEMTIHAKHDDPVPCLSIVLTISFQPSDNREANEAALGDPTITPVRLAEDQGLDIHTSTIVDNTDSVCEVGVAVQAAEGALKQMQCLSGTSAAAIEVVPDVLNTAESWLLTLERFLSHLKFVVDAVDSVVEVTDLKLPNEIQVDH